MQVHTNWWPKETQVYDLNGNNYFVLQQRILASEVSKEMSQPVVMFGHSIAGGLDVDDNKYDGKIDSIIQLLLHVTSCNIILIITVIITITIITLITKIIIN